MKSRSKLGLTQVILYFQILKLLQHSINSTNATYFWQLQPFLYIEKPSDRSSKAGEFSAYKPRFVIMIEFCTFGYNIIKVKQNADFATIKCIGTNNWFHCLFYV